MLTSFSTSPSVYVIYHTLLADYTCDENQGLLDIGPQYDAVTIGYPPDALSTGVCYHTNWRPINYTELYYPPPDYEVITQAACSMSVGDPRTVDSLPILAGSPIFSIPDDVSQVNPLWSSCTPAAPGGYDPPRVLTKTGNLVPTPILPPVSQAKPEPSATLQLAAETGAPGTPNGASPGHVSQDPSDPGGTNNQDSGASNASGAESGGDSGSTTGKQNSNAGSQQAPGVHENQPNSPYPSTTPQEDNGVAVPGAPVGKAGGSNPQDIQASSIPSVENGGGPGSTSQDNSGNVESGSSEGSKENGADPSNPSVLNDPGSASKGEPGSNSPEYDSNGGPESSSSLQEAPGGGLELGTLTIAPGAQTTHSGHVFSVGSSFVLVDGTSFDLQSPHAGTPLGSPYPSAASQQDLVGGGVVVGTTTFSSGAQTTYSGHTISVGSSIFAIDGSSYSEAAGGGLIFGTTTLPPGSQITQSGHIVSVGSSSVVIDGTSYTWAAGASSPTSTPANENLGGLIMSAFGTGAAATSSSSPLAFTGDAARSRPGRLTTTIMVAMYTMYNYIL